MKMIVKTGLTAAAILISSCASNAPITQGETDMTALPGTILVKVDGFKKREGAVAAALFDETGYKGGAQLQGQSVDVTGDSVILKFTGLSAGEYGIKMYQDVDKNGQMNSNAFGIPTEPYAFSNNAVGMMGPAKWETAKFTLTENGAVQNISFE